MLGGFLGQPLGGELALSTPEPISSRDAVWNVAPMVDSIPIAAVSDVVAMAATGDVVGLAEITDVIEQDLP